MSEMMKAAFLYIDKGKHMGIEEVAKPVDGAGPIGLMHGGLAKSKGAKVILAEY